MSVWDWVRQYRREADKGNDPSRKMLYDLYASTRSLMGKDPDAALALLRQGRTLAEKLGEKWWMAFYDHWMIQVLVFRKHDYVAGLDLAVKTVVEVRKADYAQLPQRICIHAELIDIYSDLDPHGFAHAIEDALDYMQTQIGPDLECRYCMHSRKVGFAYDMEHYAAAELAAAQHMAFVDHSTRRDAGGAHYRALARLIPCKLAFCRTAWEELLGLAREGQEIAVGKVQDAFWIIEFFMWEALGLRRLKREDEAKRAYQNGIARASGLKSLPGTGYFDALCAYHEAGGNLLAALALREQQLRNAVASSSPYYENLAQVKRCELLSQMGTLTEADLDVARAAANKLKDPSRVLTELDRFTPNS